MEARHGNTAAILLTTDLRLNKIVAAVSSAFDDRKCIRGSGGRPRHASTAGVIRYLPSRACRDGPGGDVCIVDQFGASQFRSQDESGRISKRTQAC